MPRKKLHKKKIETLDTTATGMQSPVRKSALDTTATGMQSSVRKSALDTTATSMQSPGRKSHKISKGRKAIYISLPIILISSLVFGFLILSADTTAPKVEITSPIPRGEPFFGVITIDADIIEENLDSIEILVNGTLIATSIPYDWDTGNSDNGLNIITVQAIDKSGLKGWDSVEINIFN